MELAMEDSGNKAPGAGDGLPDCDYLMGKRLTDDGLVGSDEGMVDGMVSDGMDCFGHYVRDWADHDCGGWVTVTVTFGLIAVHVHAFRHTGFRKTRKRCKLGRWDRRTKRRPVDSRCEQNPRARGCPKSPSGKRVFDIAGNE